MSGTPEQFQQIYTAALPKLRATARAAGYALAVHGSMRRDLDLIAIPWVTSYVPARDLAQRLAHTIGGSINWDGERIGKPCHRQGWIIRWDLQTLLDIGHLYIDLNVVTP